MIKKKKQEISISTNVDNSQKNSFSREDSINPIIAYSIFTSKYIIKKKSTIFAPIISFIIVLFAAMIPFFFLSPDSPDQHGTVSQVFIFSMSIALISSCSVFATVKALNLFKDISNDGMEILIVSKPIKRSQIIIVRFAFFIILGIIYSLINYFALLIGLSFSSSLMSNFNTFNFISISFFTMMMSYIFFGSISIMLSLRFSTKLVSGFSTIILSVGIVLTQIVPLTVPLIENNFFDNIRNYNSESGPEKQVNFNFHLTTNGELIIYTKNIQTPLTDEEKDILTQAWKTSDDYSWITNLNNFINPIAGITKITTPSPKLFINDAELQNSSFDDQINFSEFKLSLTNGNVKNNLWENKNYFFGMNTINLNSNLIHGLTLNLKVKTNASDISFDDKLVVFTGIKNIRNIFEENKLDNKEIEKVFDELLRMNLSNDENTKNLIINKTESLFLTSFNEIISIISSSDPTLSGIFELRLENSSNQNNLITVFDHDNFKSQLSLLLFYFYGLEKLDENINKFENRNIFLDSTISNNMRVNNFLGSDFGFYSSSFSDETNSNSFSTSQIFFQKPVSEKYETFINHGEKVSSLGVGLSWSAVTLIILVGTVMIYYRKDFT
ncbi:MAG: ABC transporter permease [Metamycoplasmataceae bacterium]